MRNGARVKRLARFAFVFVASVACVFVFWIAGRAGVARLLGRYALISADLAAAHRAATMSPSDPETHRMRAAVLHKLKGLPQAATELELALSLRPRDDSLWLQLGMLRDEMDDPSGASIAFNESVRLAPYYALPRWQRGNFLLRQGRLLEAFADLRYAAASQPEYVPSLIDLSWRISKSDYQITQEHAQIDTKEERLAFAEFLARQGKGSEAAEQFALAGPVSDKERNELVRHLISANAYQEAFQVWIKSQTTRSGDSIPEFYDGGFEGPLSFDERGFGWRMTRGSPSVKLAADSSVRQSGSKSLLIDFSGDSNPDTSLVSQVIPVKPVTRYRLYFAARMHKIVSGGLPFAVISESAGTRKRLSESPALPQGSADWQTVSFDFVTEPNTHAVTFSVQRKQCTTSPCPIFGSMWLDSFSIQELH
jgi:hypothetical protein